MQRPKFIIFTDKDGTLNMEDEELNNIFCLITTMGGMVIPATGRTIGDIKNDFIKRKVALPEVIIGDNGASIYFSINQTFFQKKSLNHSNIIKMMNQFIENGGNKNYIRYTDGIHIFISDKSEIRKYYKKNKAVKLCRDICESVKKSKDITKITLVGSKKQMEKSILIADKLNFWTDMDVTNFPKSKYQNYRLDISQKDINKGNAVKIVSKKFNPIYGYICIGNGYNDMPMFQEAIDEGMIVAIMENSSSQLIKEVKQYCQKKAKGKVLVIPNHKDLANKYILKMAKTFQTYMEKAQQGMKIDEIF